MNDLLWKTFFMFFFSKILLVMIRIMEFSALADFFWPEMGFKKDLGRSRLPSICQNIELGSQSAQS